MAGKPFLSHIGGKKGKYKFNKKSQADKENHMDGKYRKTSNSDNEPPPKKRKTEDAGEDEWSGEEGGEEFWDDSMEFTQADLEDIELQASQAYIDPKKKSNEGDSVTCPQPSTSAPGHVTFQERDVSGTFLKPQLSRSSSSSTSSLNGGRRSSTSYNMSEHSSHTSHSSHSSYPSSLSYGSNSSSSLKSGSSVENVSLQRHAVTGSMLRGVSSESLDVAGLLGRNVTVNQPSQEESSRMKQECAALKLQLSKMKEEMVVKDGENRLLRDNLKTKDEELSEIKLEKVSQITQHAKQQSDKERSLQTELTKVQTQLQFKEQEEREMKSRCGDLENRLKALQTGPSTSQPQSPRLSQKQLSPKPRRVPVEERSPKGRPGFPTRKTFLAAEVSPRKPQSSEEPASQGFTTVSGAKPVLDEGRTRLKLRSAKQTRVSGPQLVARLLDVNPTSAGQLSERGIVGLLNMPSTSSSLYNIQLDRDKNTSLLSPTRAGLAAFQTQEESSLITLVTPDSFRLSMQGLANLLTTQPADNSLPDKPPQSRLEPQDAHLLCAVTDPSSINTAKHLGQSVLDNAVLVLPLINDYLQHYIEMLDTALENSNTSTGASSSSSLDSSDPSLESPTGSLGMLLKSTANYANDLESLALASLQTLSVLVTCEGVREMLLHRDETEMEEISPTATVETSSSELEMPTSDRTSKMTHIPKKKVVKLKLLRKVIRLSNPGSKENLCNTRIILTCLRILEMLATHAVGAQINSVSLVLGEEALQHCLEREGEPRVILQALRVLNVLCRPSLGVASLCTKTAGCVLASMYGLCTPDSCLEKVPELERLQIHSLVVECIVSIASHHKDGVITLLESDCKCSVEVVKTVVCLLYAVMLSYKLRVNEAQSDSDTVVTMDTVAGEMLYVLREGLLLLHIMSLNDPSFINRHLPVQHQYVQLVCGLTRIFKRLPSESSEIELTILQDLWDFDQEDSECSQDTDTEEDPDTDRSDVHMEVS